MKDEVKDEVQVEDGEFQYSGANVGIKEITMEAYRRCLVEGSKEMARGGMTTKVVNGRVVELSVPNQKEIFFNSVRALQTVLIGHILKDKEIKSNISEIDEELKTKEEELRKLYSSTKEQAEQLSSKIKNKYSPNREYFIEEMESVKFKMSWLKLECLSILLDKLNYFEETSASVGF